MLKVDFVTLFPEMVLEATNHSILRRAQEKGLVQFSATNPREFTHDNHRTVDDNPFGGGAGMVMKCEPVAAAIESARVHEDAAVVFTDPTGSIFNQETAEEFAGKSQVVFVCGHYEGIDDRVRELFATHVLSLGDFVLTGGELPSLVMADAVVRLLPGALGSSASLEQGSHSDGLLSAPQYTRPEEFRGLAAPEVLRSGDHGKIARWRRKQALLLTRRNRPDLFWSAQLTKQDLDVLSEE